MWFSYCALVLVVLIMCNVFIPWNITNTNPNINTKTYKFNTNSIITFIECLQFAGHCSDCFMYPSQETCGAGTIIIILIFEVRNTKHRDVM